MKGLEICKKYYEEYGVAMFDSLINESNADIDFSHIKEHIAIGLIGEGSECIGFDDDVSKDHDFDPGFIIFVDDELTEKQTFRLMRAYSNLPKEYMGCTKSINVPADGRRRGVIYLRDFIESNLGHNDLSLDTLTINQYLTLPQNSFSNVVNGEIWYDGFGTITNLRKNIKSMPLDVLYKRLTGQILLMAQSGQYNYYRAVKRGDKGAASLASAKFVDAAFEVIFLLSGRFMPFYKWKFRALKELPNVFSKLYDDLYYLLSHDNFGEEAMKKEEIIERVAEIIINELKKRNITKATCSDLEKHAISLNDFIIDVNIRNLSFMYCA